MKTTTTAKKARSCTIVCTIDDGDATFTYPVGRCAAIARLVSHVKATYPGMDLVILSIDGRTKEGPSGCTDVLCGPMKRWGHVTL